MNFEELGLHGDLLDGIDAMNFKTPTPIQEQTIPAILQGRDLIGVAQTGTGKTAAFTLPVLNMIMDEPNASFVQALILVPTRELAQQIDKAIEAYGYFTGASSVAVYGGGEARDFGREKNALSQGADIVIATPGRLIAHMNMGYVNFSKLRFLILDEADRMLDMGFMPDIKRIVQKVNTRRQTLLFSATMPPEVQKLARSLTQNPATVTIALSKPAEGVTQGVYFVADEDKTKLLAKLLESRTGKCILIFSSTKQAVNRVFQQLRAKKLNVAMISSDLEQKDREEVITRYRNRTLDILVATDVLSRGIDIEGIEVVINYDIPQDAEDYVHRVGRTARAERKGEAITLVSRREMQRFKRIETLIGSEIPRMELPEGLKSNREETGSAQPNRQNRSNKRPAKGPRPPRKKKPGPPKPRD